MLLLFGFVVGHLSIVEEDGLESPSWAKSDAEGFPTAILLLFSGAILLFFGIIISVILYNAGNLQNS